MQLPPPPSGSRDTASPASSTHGGGGSTTATAPTSLEDCEEPAQDDDDPRHKCVKLVTREDVDAKRYSIVDVVLPMPGSETVWPTHDVGRLYQQYLNYDGTGGVVSVPKTMIDPHWEHVGSNSDGEYEYFHLRGDYRRVVQTVGDLTASFFTYRESRPAVQEKQTSSLRSPRLFEDERDVHVCACSRHSQSADPQLQPAQQRATSQPVPVLHLGLRCTFNLGPGSYATMALRELLRGPYNTAGKAPKCPRRIKWS